MEPKTEVAATQAEGAPFVAVEPFIDKTETARRLKKTVRTVENWMSRGLIPYYKIGHSVSFKWSEVEAHLGQTCRVCRHVLPHEKRAGAEAARLAPLSAASR